MVCVKVGSPYIEVCYTVSGTRTSTIKSFLCFIFVFIYHKSKYSRYYFMFRPISLPRTTFFFFPIKYILVVSLRNTIPLSTRLSIL